MTAAIALNGPYTLVKEYLQDSAELAREFGAPILIHVSETVDSG